jgi:hypothetical protein
MRVEPIKDILPQLCLPLHEGHPLSHGPVFHWLFHLARVVSGGVWELRSLLSSMRKRYLSKDLAPAIYLMIKLRLLVLL